MTLLVREEKSDCSHRWVFSLELYRCKFKFSGISGLFPFLGRRKKGEGKGGGMVERDVDHVSRVVFLDERMR